MQLFHGEYQVPVLTPDDVAVFNGEAAEFAWLEVLVVLRMRVATYEFADVHGLNGIVAERQTDGQVADILCFDDVKSVHNSFLLL